MGQLVAPGSWAYHELGVAVLEGAPRVPVALLLSVYHTALHSVLDLEEGKHVSRKPWPHAVPLQGAFLERTLCEEERARKMKTLGVPDSREELQAPLAGDHCKNVSLKQAPGCRVSLHPKTCTDCRR